MVGTMYAWCATIGMSWQVVNDLLTVMLTRPVAQGVQGVSSPYGDGLADEFPTAFPFNSCVMPLSTYHCIGERSSEKRVYILTCFLNTSDCAPSTPRSFHLHCCHRSCHRHHVLMMDVMIRTVTMDVDGAHDDSLTVLIMTH